MKTLLEVVYRTVILFIVLVVGFIPVGTAFAAPVLNLAYATNTGPIAPGQNVTYMMTVSNTGDTSTGTINLNALVPNNTTVPMIQTDGARCSSSGNAVICLPGELLIWQISLNPGASLSRQFSALVDSTLPPPDGTVITSTASTSLGLSIDASVVVRSNAGLNITLDSIPNSVSPGGEYQYKLTYGNAGSSAVDVDLSFSLPAGAGITSASDGGVVFADTVTWNIGVLSAGISGTRYVHAQVPVSAVDGALVLAGAQLLDNAGVEQPASANIVTSVGNVTPLELAVSTLPDPVQPGQNVSYVVNVSNPSTSTTGTINLNARVPNHTTVPMIQTDGARCSSSGNAVTCLPGELLIWQISLNPGASLSRQFSVLVDSISPPANGTLLSTVVNTSRDGGAAVTGEAVVGSDTDGDGVNDASDNCTLIPNPDQRDTDADGFGNICDPDLNNDLIVQAADLALFKPLFFTTDPDADFDGNGVVNAGDLAILKTFFFKVPGPSGLNP